MRLARPFFRLPIRFDAVRMQREVNSLPQEAWVEHPHGTPGNSAARLISARGAENDDVDGEMQPTRWLLSAPYLRQVLASLGVVWSRSRLMRLAAGASVPEHADINYHWFYRVRVHFPIVTDPAVVFRCGDESVHMSAGEAWIFDNWRRHSVVNASQRTRIHLVADTTGNSQFWNLVARGQTLAAPKRHRFDSALTDVSPATEKIALAPVMQPAEVDLLLRDLQAELTTKTSASSDEAIFRYSDLLEGFRQDWRQLYSIHGTRPGGWSSFQTLAEELRSASRELGEHLCTRTNAIDAHRVLEGRFLRAALPGAAKHSVAPARAGGAHSRAAHIERPLFIVAAPRSGSTLLFETLASSSQLASLGGEAHWLVEDIESLRVGNPSVDSNRLTAENATDAVRTRIEHAIRERALDAQGVRVAPGSSIHLVEKTPKNALRIPFFKALFPDAKFLFLWRDPRENLSSIIEAWRAGTWKTYDRLEGFRGPWSMLLPPGWRAMNGRPLEEIAAFQWTSTNDIALNDLDELPQSDWTSLTYANLSSNPVGEITRVCLHFGIEPDQRLLARLGAPLPLARYTLTPPDPDKWRRNADLISRVLPQVEATWSRLMALERASLQSPKTNAYR